MKIFSVIAYQGSADISEMLKEADRNIKIIGKKADPKFDELRDSTMVMIPKDIEGCRGCSDKDHQKCILHDRGNIAVLDVINGLKECNVFYLITSSYLGMPYPQMISLLSRLRCFANFNEHHIQNKEVYISSLAHTDNSDIVYNALKLMCEKLGFKHISKIEYPGFYY